MKASVLHYALREFNFFDSIKKRGVETVNDFQNHQDTVKIVYMLGYAEHAPYHDRCLNEKSESHPAVRP